MDIANMSISQLQLELKKYKNDYLRCQLIQNVLDKKILIEKQSLTVYDYDGEEDDIVNDILNNIKKNKKSNKPPKKTDLSRDDLNDNLYKRFGSDVDIVKSSMTNKKSMLRPFASGKPHNTQMYSKF